MHFFDGKNNLGLGRIWSFVLGLRSLVARLAPFERVGTKSTNFFGNGKCELIALLDVPKHGSEADVLSCRRICYHTAHKLPSILSVTVGRWLVLGRTCLLQVGPVGCRLLVRSDNVVPWWLTRRAGIWCFLSEEFCTRSVLHCGVVVAGPLKSNA